jgi:crossover junction endodeoxyribonuclease RuvC
MHICGIDPGLGVSGYAVVEPDGEAACIRDAGVCRTDADADLADRLGQIQADFIDLFEQWRPRIVAVEQLYAHYKHPRTAILMGHARGVMLATASRLNIPVRSYSATQIKRFLTGNGRASKPQVQRAVASAFGLDAPPEPPDVADALAIALGCAYDLRRNPLEAKPG